MSSIIERLQRLADATAEPSFMMGDYLEHEYGDIYHAALKDLVLRLGIPDVIPEGLVFVITRDFRADSQRILKGLGMPLARGNSTREKALSRTFSWFSEDKMYFAVLIDHQRVGTGIVNGSYLPPREQWSDLNTRLPADISSQDIFDEYLLSLRAVAHELGRCRDNAYRLIPYGRDYLNEGRPEDINPHALHNARALWGGFYGEYYAYLSLPQDTVNEEVMFKNTRKQVLDYLEKNQQALNMPLKQAERYVPCSQNALKAVAYEIGRLCAFQRLPQLKEIIAPVKEINPAFATLITDLSEVLQELLALKPQDWQAHQLDGLGEILNRGFQYCGFYLSFDENGQMLFNTGPHEFV